MYTFNELFLPLQLYSSTYIANITCLSLGRHGCVENTDQKMLNCEQQGVDCGEDCDVVHVG
jgi:hypothetical protein